MDCIFDHSGEEGFLTFDVTACRKYSLTDESIFVLQMTFMKKKRE